MRQAHPPVLLIDDRGHWGKCSEVHSDEGCLKRRISSSLQIETQGRQRTSHLGKCVRSWVGARLGREDDRPFEAYGRGGEGAFVGTWTRPRDEDRSETWSALVLRLSPCRPRGEEGERWREGQRPDIGEARDEEGEDTSCP